MIKTGVFYIPPDRPFLRELAAGLLAATKDTPEDLSAYQILLPTRRAVRALTDCFLDLRDGRPLLLPRMQAVADVEDQDLSLWVAAATGTLPDIPDAITPMARRLLLTRLVQARDPHMQYECAAQLAGALATFLDQIQNEDLTLDQLDHLVPDEFAVHWQDVVAFLSVIRKAWPDILAERGVMDPCMRRNMLLRLLAAHWATHPPAHPVIVAGVTGSLPAVADLMDVIRTLPQGQVILPGFDAFMPENMWAAVDDQHPYFEINALLTRFDMSATHIPIWPACPVQKNQDTPRAWLWRQVMAPPALAPNWAHLATTLTPTWRDRIEHDLGSIRIIEADTLFDEAQTIALLVRASLEDADKTIAIVTPDRALATAITQACARFHIQVNDSGGQILSTMPAGVFFRLILQTRMHGLHPVDILALLRHPMMAKTGLSDTLVSALEIKALRGLRPPSDPDSFLESVVTRCGIEGPALRAGLAPIVSVLARLDPTLRQPLHNWVTLHIQVAEALSDHSESGVSTLWGGDDGAMVSQLCLDLLASSDIFSDAIDLATYTALIAHHMASMRVNLVRDDHPRVALLGLYESRLIGADHVILAGFNEGTWPADPGSDPWMSTAMRAQYGLPARTVSVGRTALDLIQMVQNPRVTLTRTRVQDGTTTLPSRWLERLETVLMSLFPKTPSLCRDFDFLNLSHSLDRPAQTTPVTRPIPCPPVSLRPTRWSASTIEHLQIDPYAIFAQKILRLKKYDPIDQDIDGAWRGHILHRILEDFVSTHRGLLNESHRADLSQTLNHVLNTVLDNKDQIARIIPRLTKTLESYFEMDQNRRLIGYVPRFFESTWAREIHIAGQSHVIHARLDRLDQRPDGRFAILDYKTGSAIPPYRDVERGKAPQLSIQLWVAEGGEDDAGHAGLPISEIGFWVLQHTGSTLRLWETGCTHDIALLQEYTETGLTDLITHFMRPEQGFPCWPDSTRAPKTTDYHHLARLAEWSQNEGSAA